MADSDTVPSNTFIPWFSVTFFILKHSRSSRLFNNISPARPIIRPFFIINLKTYSAFLDTFFGGAPLLLFLWSFLKKHWRYYKCICGSFMDFMADSDTVPSNPFIPWFSVTFFILKDSESSVIFPQLVVSFGLSVYQSKNIFSILGYFLWWSSLSFVSLGFPDKALQLLSLQIFSTLFLFHLRGIHRLYRLQSCIRISSQIELSFHMAYDSCFKSDYYKVFQVCSRHLSTYLIIVN